MMEPVYRGKVREIYDVSDEHLVIVTTDRISAFDSILPVLVKDKGVILNQLSNFWFEKTKHIIPNHVVEDRVEYMPPFFQKEGFRKRTVMVEKLQMLSFEFVVRGYLFGTMWNAYKKREVFCGMTLSGDHELAQKLDEPVLTPSIKHDVGHDEYVSLECVEKQLGKERTSQIANVCLELYSRCSEYALSRGLIIADAKFEFGCNTQGELVLADEIFTPDSSRFWDVAEYETGVSPNSFDKQLLRDWLSDHKVNGEYPFDRVPEHVLEQTRQRYEECLYRLIDPKLIFS